MAVTWIVSANASRARIFCEIDPNKPLEEIETMTNDAARLRTSESETDRMGPTSAGQSIHNTGGALPNKQYEPNQTPVEHATEMFAKDVSEFLNKGRNEHRYDKLALVASPEFLGTLRRNLGPQLEKAVDVELNKDYTRLSDAELQEHLHAVKH